jgi:hypothetical protein
MNIDPLIVALKATIRSAELEEGEEDGDDDDDELEVELASEDVDPDPDPVEAAAGDEEAEGEAIAVDMRPPGLVKDRVGVGVEVLLSPPSTIMPPVKVVLI